MAQAEIYIDDAAVQKHLQIAIESLSDDNLAKWAHDYATPYLRERARKRFASEGDDASGPWEPLADSTLKRKSGNRILRDTGKFYRYVTNTTSGVSRMDGGIEAVFPKRQPTGDHNQKILGFTQEGTRNQPSREVIASSEVDTQALMQLLEEYAISGWTNGA